MHIYRWNHTLPHRIRNTSVALPCAVEQLRTTCVLLPKNVKDQQRSAIRTIGTWKGSRPNSDRNPHLSMTRLFSTTPLMGSLFSIQLSHRNTPLTADPYPTNGSSHTTDGCRRTYNRKAKHGSKKKKNKKQHHAMEPAQSPQKRLTLPERLELEDEQARQRHLYRRPSSKPPELGVTGQSRKFLKDQEKERLLTLAKCKRILSVCDYWFSDINLRNDVVLRNILKRYHGYVPVKVFLSFPKFHYWTDGQLLVQAFKSAEDRYKVRFDPNLWRPPYPLDYVKPQSEKEEGDDKRETLQQGVVNGASTETDTMDVEEEDDNHDYDDDDPNVSDDEEDYREFDSDTDHRSDEDDYSDDEDRSEDDGDYSEDEEYTGDDAYSDIDEKEEEGAEQAY
jgi:hypothetical protein